MPSYRHGFHAGNHADVLKHLALVALLRILTRKDKPLVVLDTHAGAGMHSLEQGFAVRNAEFRNGIAMPWECSGPRIACGCCGVGTRASP